MRKKLLLFIIPISLFSADIKKSEVQAIYQEGLGYYKSNDFTASYKLFKSIYLQKLNDVNFNFQFGHSAYETGNYETALAAFERADMQDPTNIRNQLEMARTYYKLKMYVDAENAYQTVLDKPNTPANVKRNIEFSLAQVAQAQQKSFTYATITADILYDSNINYGGINDYEFAGINIGRTEAISDTALQSYANVTNIYDIGRRNGFAIKNSVSAYFKNYRDTDAFDVLYLSYEPSLIYKETFYTAELVLGLDHLELGDVKYLSSHSVMPRFELSHSPTMRSIAYLKYQDKSFALQSNSELDTKRYEASYALQSLLTPNSYLQGNLVASAEREKRGESLNVVFDELKFSTSYANQLSSTYSFDLYAHIRQRDYDGYSSGFDSTRSDIGTLANIGFNIQLMPKLLLKFSASYNYVDSNQARYTYKKTTATAGLVKTF